MPLQGKPSKDDSMLQRKIELSPGGPDPEKSDRVMLVRNRISRIFYRRRFFDYPISIKPATFMNMGIINTIKVGFSYLYSMIKKREENSLEDFYINRFGSRLYKMFFEDYTEKVWGIHPSKLSSSWGAQRVKELSVSAVLKEAVLKIFNPKYKTGQTSLIDQFMYPKLGPGQLWSIMAEKICAMGGEIWYNTEVVKLRMDGNVVKEIGIKKSDESIQDLKADYVFSTMPIKDLAIAFDEIPGDVKDIASNLPYRDFITVGLLVKKLALQNKTKIKTIRNIVPDCWIYIQERDVRVGRLQIFNNWSPYMVKNFPDTVWIGLEYFCNEGDSMWNMAENDFIELAVQEMAKLHIINKEDVLDASLVKIQKAYPAYFGSYSEFGKVRAFLDTIGNLYCLGRNGQHKYNNMDHSMLTAIEAVSIIKSGEKDRSSVWNINTEEEYHETSKN
jgi:protoporphyrinogen oxidase